MRTKTRRFMALILMVALLLGAVPSYSVVAVAVDNPKLSLETGGLFLRADSAKSQYQIGTAVEEANWITYTGAIFLNETDTDLMEVAGGITVESGAHTVDVVGSFTPKAGSSVTNFVKIKSGASLIFKLSQPTPKNVDISEVGSNSDFVVEPGGSLTFDIAKDHILTIGGGGTAPAINIGTGGTLKFANTGRLELSGEVKDSYIHNDGGYITVDNLALLDFTGGDFSTETVGIRCINGGTFTLNKGVLYTSDPYVNFSYTIDGVAPTGSGAANGGAITFNGGSVCGDGNVVMNSVAGIRGDIQFGGTGTYLATQLVEDENGNIIDLTKEKVMFTSNGITQPFNNVTLNSPANIPSSRLVMNAGDTLMLGDDAVVRHYNANIFNKGTIGGSGVYYAYGDYDPNSTGDFNPQVLVLHPTGSNGEVSVDITDFRLTLGEKNGAKAYVRGEAFNNIFYEMVNYTGALRVTGRGSGEVSVSGSTHDVVFENVEIYKNPSTTGTAESAIPLAVNDSTLNLTLEGNNSLLSSSTKPALYVAPNSVLNITGGILRVQAFINTGVSVEGTLNLKDTVILTSSLDAGTQSRDAWEGVVFEGNYGTVYGDTTIYQSLNMYDYQALTSDVGTTLNIASGVTLTNDGTFTANGEVTGEGTLEGSGVFEFTVPTQSMIRGVSDDYAYTGSKIEITPTLDTTKTMMGQVFTFAGEEQWSYVIEKETNGSWAESEVNTAGQYRVRYTGVDVGEVTRTFTVTAPPSAISPQTGIYF